MLSSSSKTRRDKIHVRLQGTLFGSIIPSTLTLASMSASRGRVEDTYESQNDQQLEDLHSKIRTLRGVSLGHALLQGH
jgi:hypothetical protein